MFQLENTTKYYRDGVDTTKFTIDYISTHGRWCQGNKWFGYILSGTKIPTSKLVFCANNYFEEGETYEEIVKSFIHKSCKIANKPLVERCEIKKYISDEDENLNEFKIIKSDEAIKIERKNLILIFGKLYFLSLKHNHVYNI
jgi:hypothetical protein